MSKFHDRIAVITGGSSGIGLAIAELFYQQGVKIIILDLVAPNASDDKFEFYSCDVANETAINAVFTCIKQAHGKIDYLINNAGIQRYGSVTETSLEEWRQVMDVHLTAAFLCAKEAIPLMQKGVIINMASTAALSTQARTASYTTAKSALLGLTRSIALDYAPNIRCVAICPGTIDTPLLQRVLHESSDPAGMLAECEAMHPMQRIGTSEEVANLVVFLCSDAASFITGHYYRVDGGQGINIPGSTRS